MDWVPEHPRCRCVIGGNMGWERMFSVTAACGADWLRDNCPTALLSPFFGSWAYREGLDIYMTAMFDYKSSGWRFYVLIPAKVSIDKFMTAQEAMRMANYWWRNNCVEQRERRSKINEYRRSDKGN